MLLQHDGLFFLVEAMLEFPHQENLMNPVDQVSGGAEEHDGDNEGCDYMDEDKVDFAPDLVFTHIPESLHLDCSHIRAVFEVKGK